MPKIYKVQELFRRCRSYDKSFQLLTKRGKGSERILYHPNIGGEEKSYPLKCHGLGDDVKKPHYKQIVRRFKLPKDFF